MANVSIKISTQEYVQLSVCVRARANTETPSCFQSIWNLNQTQGLGFTSVLFYVCGPTGKNHLTPAAAKSSQQAQHAGLGAPACSTTGNNTYNSATWCKKQLLKALRHGLWTSEALLNKDVKTSPHPTMRMLWCRYSHIQDKSTCGVDHTPHLFSFQVK